MAFSTRGCRLKTGSRTGSASGAMLSDTVNRFPNLACSSSRYASTKRSSSATVVRSVWDRNVARRNSAKVTISSRAVSGLVLTRPAIAVSVVNEVRRDLGPQHL